MKKSFITTIIILAGTLSSCQKAEYVLPTDTGQGITSLTAKFTSGPYVEQEAVKFDITDPTVTKYVIPVPWFYPESSDNETTPYMTAMKVQAALANNCRIEPNLSILDLTKENAFTVTEADGEKRTIYISGQRTKSDKSSITFFSIESAGITGLIDQTRKTISLITIDDLSSVDVDVSLSPHATISPSLKGINLNDPVQVTVTAHNGTTSTVYTVEKTAPTKISYGFRKGSQTNLFNIDLAALNLAGTKPTLAAVGNYLVVSSGDGSAPKYFNRSTAKALGNIVLGAAKGDGSVASDAAGNMLITDMAGAGEMLKIYKTNSVSSAPQSFISWNNSSGFPLGSKVAIQGNLNGNALIIVTCESTSASAANKFVRWVVTGGVPGTAEVIEAKEADAWLADQNGTKIVSRSTDPADGAFLAFYNGASGYSNTLKFLDGRTNTLTKSLGEQTSGNGWGLNNNALDAKEFNNAKYLALYTPSYFPNWGLYPGLYLYDVTGTSNFSGNIDKSPALQFSAQVNGFGVGNSGGRGDVLIAPTADGYKMQVFVIDYSVMTLSCYEFDCVDVK